MKQKIIGIIVAFIAFAAISPALANPLGISVDGFQVVSSVATAQGIERGITLSVTNVSASVVSSVQISIFSVTEDAVVLQGDVTTQDIQPGQQVLSTAALVQTNGTATDYLIQIQYSDANGNPHLEKHPLVM